jgi:hypothetical protein
MRYALSFIAAALVLTFGALASFRRIERSSRTAALAAPFPVADTTPHPDLHLPLVPARADYARFATEDSAWRAANARPYSIAELARRGDGRATARDSMQDRVYEFTKHGKTRLAIAELERWVARHPGDAHAQLSLARLLNASGRSNEAIMRYRRVLALPARSGAE